MEASLFICRNFDALKSWNWVGLFFISGLEGIFLITSEITRSRNEAMVDPSYDAADFHLVLYSCSFCGPRFRKKKLAVVFLGSPQQKKWKRDEKNASVSGVSGQFRGVAKSNRISRHVASVLRVFHGEHWRLNGCISAHFFIIETQLPSSLWSREYHLTSVSERLSTHLNSALQRSPPYHILISQRPSIHLISALQRSLPHHISVLHRSPAHLTSVSQRSPTHHVSRSTFSLHEVLCQFHQVFETQDVRAAEKESVSSYANFLPACPQTLPHLRIFPAYWERQFSGPTRNVFYHVNHLSQTLSFFSP